MPEELTPENESTIESSTPLLDPSKPNLSSEELLAQADDLWGQSEVRRTDSPITAQPFIDPTGLDEQLDPTTVYSRHSDVPIPQEEDPSYWADAGRGFVYGGLGFVESLLDLAGDAGNTAIWLAEKSGLNEEGGFRFGEVDINDAFTPQTWLGHAIGGITQVAAGYALTAATLGIAAPAGIAATAAGTGVAAGRYGRFLKYAAFTKDTAWGRFRRGMTIGAIADFVAFKEHEDRLSNLIKEWPILGNPITQYLAADKSDNWLEGRFKNALEGAGIGALAEFALLPILRTQKKVRAKLQEGKFNEAMKLQREAGPEFLENLKQIRDGEEVIVLHNEEYLRQYLTLLPDMDPSKMHAAVTLFKTAARLNNFSNLNSYLQQGLRTATLNKGLPGGALGDLDHSVFSNIEHMGLGKKGPLGDGTPYALFEEDSFKGIRNLLDDRKISYTTHTRTNGLASGSAVKADENIFIAPGMSVAQAKKIAIDSGQNSFVTNHGIYQSIEDAGGIRWKVRPLKDVSIAQVGSKKTKDTPGSYRFMDSNGEEMRYDLKYADDLEEISSLPAGGDQMHLTQAKSKRYPEAVEGGWGDKHGPQWTKDSAKTLNKDPRAAGDIPKGTSEDDFANLNDVLRIYKGVSLYSINDTMSLLGKTPPDYLNHVTQFLERQKSKAINGGMTVRDMMKAALMTVGSQQTTAKSWAHKGVKGLSKEQSKVGVQAKLKSSMQYGIAKTKKYLDAEGKVIDRPRDATGKLIKKRVYRDKKSVLDIDEMRKDFNYYKTERQGTDARPDEFITFLEWVEQKPSKGASWRKGERVGGSRAFKKSHFKGVQENSAKDMVRPEEYVALWTMSPNGRMALDALENGEVLTHLWEELRHLRAAIGSDALTNTNLLPKILRQAERVEGSAKVARGMTTKFNITDLQDVVDRFNNHMVNGTVADGTVKPGWKGKGDWDTDYIGSIFKEVSGISDAKEGFMKHYLGIGDTSTIDSAQLRFWLTGLKKGQMGAKGSVEEMHRLLYSKAIKMMKGKNRQDFIARVKESNEGLLDRLKKDDVANEDLTAHVLHHWLWDKVMDSESLTPSARTAMVYAQKNTIGTIKGAVTFGGDGEAVLNLFTKSFSDRYGRTYEASDFSTIVHEISHIYRRAMKDPIALRRKEAGQVVEGFQRGPSYDDAIDEIERFLKVKDGNWTVKQEEQFAGMFEKWIMEGGEVEGLEKAFGQMKGWMEELYRNVHNSPMKGSITPEIKTIFSKIFGREGLPTFLTSKDHSDLANSFDEAIEEGLSLENSLESVGMNLRQWSNETEA